MPSLPAGLLAMFAAVAVQAAAPTQAERNEALVRAYFDEVWSGGRVDALDRLLAPDYVNHTPSFGHPPPGPEGLKPIVEAIRAAFPDLHYVIEDVIATPTHVVARVRMQGTQTGPLFGAPPTGRRIDVRQINIERIEHGRIVEHWRVTDELEMQRQLGLVPR
jgi:steroid delta-isomerase-like uncharacterized protein